MSKIVAPASSPPRNRTPLNEWSGCETAAGTGCFISSEPPPLRPSVKSFSSSPFVSGCKSTASKLTVQAFGEKSADYFNRNPHHNSRSLAGRKDTNTKSTRTSNQLKIFNFLNSVVARCFRCTTITVEVKVAAGRSPLADRKDTAGGGAPTSNLFAGAKLFSLGPQIPR